MLCNTCRLDKPSNDFYFRNKEKGTRAKQCKTCANLYRKTHYNKNKSLYIERSRKRDKIARELNAQNIISYLREHPCIVCGETDPIVLDFDHRDMQEKLYNVSSMITQCSWNTIKKEIAKCDVLCANCHRRKTAKQLNHLRYILIYGEKS